MNGKETETHIIRKRHLLNQNLCNLMEIVIEVRVSLVVIRIVIRRARTSGEDVMMRPDVNSLR